MGRADAGPVRRTEGKEAGGSSVNTESRAFYAFWKNPEKYRVKF